MHIVGSGRLCAAQRACNDLAMRCAALGLLVGCFGCNQIFGLHQTVELDAAGPGRDAQAPNGSLRWVIADGTPLDSMHPALPQAAIVPSPVIQLGPLDTGTLTAVSYRADGTFVVPLDLLGRNWRLVYTLPSDPVPHEIQWQASTPQIVVPRTSRANPAPVPAMSKYEITATNLDASMGFNEPTLVTSGVFTNSRIVTAAGAIKVTFDFEPSARPLLGPEGAPERAKGDWVLLADWVAPTSTTLDKTIGLGWTNQLDLVANTTSMAGVTWKTDNVGHGVMTADSIAHARMNFALSSLVGTDEARHMTYGLSPSLQLPPFIEPNQGLSPFRVGLAETSPYQEVPVLLPLFDEANIESSLDCVDVDPNQVRLPHVLYARFQNTRQTAGGLRLTSSLAMITNSFDVSAYPASLSTKETLDTVDLWAADGTMISATTGPMTLAFVPDMTHGESADEFIVTLYEIMGTTLKLIRTYEVIAPKVRIDGPLLQVGHSYAFEISSHKGVPNASDGDLATITFPFGSSTKFTGTFTMKN